MNCRFAVYPAWPPQTLLLSHKTHAWQNIAPALGSKAALLVLAGSATLWMAVVADVGASLLVVLCGLRLPRGVR
ncbi:MAG: hypothetical protein ACK4R2_13260 [Roseateles sp.]